MKQSDEEPWAARWTVALTESQLRAAIDEPLLPMPIQEQRIRSLLYHMTDFRKDFQSQHMQEWFDTQIAHLHAQLVTRNRKTL